MYFLHLVCACVHAHAVTQMEVRGRLMGISSLFLGSKPGLRAWQQGPFSTNSFASPEFVCCLFFLNYLQ